MSLAGRRSRSRYGWPDRGAPPVAGHADGSGSWRGGPPGDADAGAFRCGPARRSRPPSPTARDNSRMRKSRSASAWTTRPLSLISRLPRGPHRSPRAAGGRRSWPGRRAALQNPPIRKASAPDRSYQEGCGGRSDPARHEVEHVELPTGMREEPREIVQALEVTQCHGVFLERYGPVVAFQAKALGFRWPSSTCRVPTGDGADPDSRPASTSAPAARSACARPVRANAASWGAPTRLHSWTAVSNPCRAPAISLAASRTRPSAIAALAASALLSNDAATRASSSAASRAPRRSPAATSISTRAASSGARRRSVFGGRSLDGTVSGWSSASRMDAAANATSP